MIPGQLYNQRPVSTIVLALKYLETNNHLLSFGAQVYVSTPTSKNISMESSSNRRSERPEPVRLFQLHNFLKPEYADLGWFMDRDAIGFLCHLQKLLDWILFGYDDVMKGELMAKLEVEGFKIIEEEFEDYRIGLRPVLVTKQGVILLSKLDEPYHKGSFQYLHEQRP